MTIAHYLNGPGTGGRRKIGLALSSGMARGWGHIGVIKALAKLGFTFDVISGLLGRRAGGRLLSRRPAGRAGGLGAVAEQTQDRQLSGHAPAQRRADRRQSRLVEEMRKYIGHVQIEDFGIPYAAMTTDLVTGHEIWLQKGDLIEAMRASFSLPGIFPAGETGGALAGRRGAGLSPTRRGLPGAGRRYGDRGQSERRYHRQVAPPRRTPSRPPPVST